MESQIKQKILVLDILDFVIFDFYCGNRDYSPNFRLNPDFWIVKVSSVFKCNGLMKDTGWPVLKFNSYSTESLLITVKKLWLTREWDFSHRDGSDFNSRESVFFDIDLKVLSKRKQELFRICSSLKRYYRKLSRD